MQHDASKGRRIELKTGAGFLNAFRVWFSKSTQAKRSGPVSRKPKGRFGRSANVLLGKPGSPDIRVVKVIGKDDDTLSTIRDGVSDSDAVTVTKWSNFDHQDILDNGSTYDQRRFYVRVRSIFPIYRLEIGNEGLRR